jgi:hypothetical protein
MIAIREGRTNERRRDLLLRSFLRFGASGLSLHYTPSLFINVSRKRCYAEAELILDDEIARKMVGLSRVNAVVLCADGVATRAIRNRSAFCGRWIQENARQGIRLSTIGFGMGNDHEVFMEKLASDGRYR